MTGGNYNYTGYDYSEQESPSFWSVGYWDVATQGAMGMLGVGSQGYLIRRKNYSRLERLGARYSELQQAKIKYANHPERLAAAQERYDKYFKEVFRTKKSPGRGRAARYKGARGARHPLELAVEESGLTYKKGMGWVGKSGNVMSRTEAASTLGKLAYKSGAKIANKGLAPIVIGMEILSAVSEGGMRPSSLAKGVAKGAAKTYVWATATTAAAGVYAGFMAANIWNPVGWTMAALTFAAVGLFGDKAVDKISEITGKVVDVSTRAGREAKRLSFYNDIIKHQDNYYGSTLRERSVNLAAKHGLNARFALGNEGMLFHKSI